MRCSPEMHRRTDDDGGDDNDNDNDNDNDDNDDNDEGDELEEKRGGRVEWQFGGGGFLWLELCRTTTMRERARAEPSRTNIITNLFIQASPYIFGLRRYSNFQVPSPPLDVLTVMMRSTGLSLCSITRKGQVISIHRRQISDSVMSMELHLYHGLTHL